MSRSCRLAPPNAANVTTYKRCGLTATTATKRNPVCPLSHDQIECTFMICKICKLAAGMHAQYVFSAVPS